jgi:succinate-semialdehyde dehydrogenase/glutarate-semialdehyde dehydrogenase
MRTLQNFINGEWTDSSSTETLTAVNPATEQPIALIPVGSVDDVDQAVTAARLAQPGWAALPVEERVAVLLGAVDTIEAHAEELVACETAEMGKPGGIGLMFLANGTSTMRNGVNDALDYEFSGHIKTDQTGVTDVVRKPIGVVAVIVPWNFTVAAILMAIGPFLAAGNTVVVKASEKATPSAVRLFELLDLPAGVLNLVLGDRRAGAPLAEHPGVNLVHFTGSVGAGKSVGAATGGNLTRAVLELGGKDPVVIDEDVDVQQVAEAVAFGAFVNSGQICTSMERIYVHEKIADQFVSALSAAAAAQVMGLPSDPSTVLGPMVDDVQRQIVHGQVTDALSKGAKAVTGGALPDREGFFYPATVLVDVDDSMAVMRDETFGPVAAVQTVGSFAEGVAEASKTAFGLAATVYTKNPEHIALSYSIPAGILWINQWQGGDLGRHMEPAADSGMGAMGGRLAYDAATRPMAVHYPAV